MDTKQTEYLYVIVSGMQNQHDLSMFPF
jgi:hypothetical protein